VLPGPVESEQYTSSDYTQVLDDHRVLASVDDALDNAMAESFLDSVKTELITDRVWRTRSQLELAVVLYISWLNHDRLHESLGDIPRRVRGSRRKAVQSIGSMNNNQNLQTQFPWNPVRAHSRCYATAAGGQTSGENSKTDSPAITTQCRLHPPARREKIALTCWLARARTKASL
jgi:hypothetical protein